MSHSHSDHDDMPNATDHSGHPHSGDKNDTDSLTGTGDHSGHMMHQMSPYLFTRATDFYVLFEEADIQSTGGFIGALAGSFLFALLATAFSLVMHVHEKQALDGGGGVGKSLLGSMLHGMRQLLHYVAMLIVMTMNVWVILVVVAGHSVGWLVFKMFLKGKVGGGGGGGGSMTMKEQGMEA